MDPLAPPQSGDCPPLRPYAIQHNKLTGRSLVACQPLRAGHLILQEKPIILGPVACSAPVCLACNSPITPLYRCPNCQWPVCSQECAQHPEHQQECLVLSQDTKQIGVPTSSDPTPRYDLILILRFLLLEKNNLKHWEMLMSLEGHWERRKVDSEAHHVAAVRYFMAVCPTGHDEDTIHKVRGIIITNCINSRTSCGVNLRGMYNRISFLNHSCRPTISLRADCNSQLFVNTAVDLDEDEPLTFCYLPPGDPQWKRQRDLLDTYYFVCSCERCIDRTELNTHFSALKCGHCNKAFIDPMFNKKKSYRCVSCRYTLPQMKVMHISIGMQALYGREDLIVDVHSAMELLKTIHSKGHGKHYTWLACASVILRSLAKLTSIDGHRLRKQLWMRVIDMYSILEPGMTRRRGVSLLQLASVAILLAIQDFNIGRISKESLIAEAERCHRHLAEARQIMSLEPPESTEQRWLMMEDKETRRLEEIMEQLEDMQPGQHVVDDGVDRIQAERIKELEEITKQESEKEDSEASDQE